MPSPRTLRHPNILDLLKIALLGAIWGSAFLMRVHHMSLSETGVAMALVQGPCGALGTFLGGRFSDVLSRRDERFGVWVAAAGGLLSFPFLTFFLLWPERGGALGGYAVAMAFSVFVEMLNLAMPEISGHWRGPDAVAEAAKLTENIFRAVNIALVNELKLVYAEMGIDVWEVIAAAATKPFGYQAFYPGPGLGGHCIPIDPFYLTWKAREYGIESRFIELAGQINTAMPRYVVSELARALNAQEGKGLKGAKVLILGLAYKSDVDDLRESPSLTLIDLVEAQGAEVDFHDPHIPVVPMTREHAELAGRASVALTPETLGGYDAVLISTDHAAVDYNLVAAHAKLIVDTRNALAKRGIDAAQAVKA